MDQTYLRKSLNDSAWTVLLGCFVMYMLVVGSVKAYGVLYTEMVDYYSSSSGSTAWIGAIALVLQTSLGPAANLLCKIFSFRRVTMIGGVLVGLGYFLSGFVRRVEYMYLTFLITGIGYGFTFAPCSTIISYYFDKRRGLANGITVAGSGVGAIVLPFLYKYLIEQYGLQGTFQILGGIFSNICVASCFLKQPECLVQHHKERIRSRVNINSERTGDEQAELCKSDKRNDEKRDKTPCNMLNLRFSLFKSPEFTLHIVSFMCCTFGYMGSLILIPANVEALGYDKTYVAVSVTIFGGVELVARILMGWFADLNIIQRKYIYGINMFIGGIFSLIVPYFDSFSFIAVYAAVVATFLGSYLSLTSLLIIDVVGLQNLAPAVGILSLSCTFSILPSQPTAGWLYDMFGNWHASFVLNGCMFILAGILILLRPMVVGCCIRKDSDDNKYGQTDI